VPVAYLCLGRVPEFGPEPELQRLGWLARMDLQPLIYEDRWGQPSDLAPADATALPDEREGRPATRSPLP